MRPVSDRPVDRKRLFEALVALREAEDPSAPTLWPEWNDVSHWLDVRFGARERDHDEIRQRTLLRVMRHVESLEAKGPAGAEAWLRRIYERLRIDRIRARKRDPVEEGLRVVRNDGALPPVDRLRAPEPARAIDEDEALAAAMARVVDAVDHWLEGHVKNAQKRLGDRQRAQVALASIVWGLGYEGIVERLGLEPPPGRPTVYKWVERGREQVLRPALAFWAETARDDEAVVLLTGALGELLDGSRRADAGKPRPARRKKRPAPATGDGVPVSRAPGETSVQAGSRPRSRSRRKGRSR